MVLILVMSVLRLTALAGEPNLMTAESGNLADYYGFDEIEVIKLDWGIENLLVADFDSDGLKDIAIANNRRSRIEFLFQRAKPADDDVSITVDPADTDINEFRGTTRFAKKDLPVAQRIFSMTCGDLNSDGLRI